MAMQRITLGSVDISLSLLSSLILLLAALHFNPVWASIETYTFANDHEARRFAGLTEELRCPKCQNQSLADSDSIIATDLRRQVKTMLDQGQSDEDIRFFMVQRYGDFILYDPPFKLATLFLWLMPLVLVGAGAVFLWRFQRRQQAITEALSAAEQAQLEAILSEDSLTQDGLAENKHTRSYQDATTTREPVHE